MIPITKRNEILLQLDALNPKQAEKVMEYIRSVLDAKRSKSKTLKRKALIQIRTTLTKPL